MIYDCFTFYNEFELLELRLRTLWDSVDRFVVVEADKTHSGQPKEFNLEQQRARFADFEEKLIYIKVSDMPAGEDAWLRENFQRNCILRGLAQSKPEDIILISDMDEIPRPETLHALISGPEGRELLDKHPVAFAQRNYYYFVNCIEPRLWHGTVCMKQRNLQTPQEARNNRERMPRIRYGGWHFSYLGGVQRVIEKFNAFAHQEANIPENTAESKVSEAISQGLSSLQMDKNPVKYHFVKLDESYPATIHEAVKKYPVLYQESQAAVDGRTVYPQESDCQIYNRPRWYWYLMKKKFGLV